EAEAHPEEDVAGVLEVGHARVAEGAEEHRGALALDGDLDLFGEGGAIAQEALGAEVELPEVEGEAGLVAVELEEELGLERHRGADAVAPDDGVLLALAH